MWWQKTTLTYYFITLWVRRSDIGFNGLKIKVLAGLQYFLQASRKNCYLAFSQLLEATDISWPMSLPPASNPAVLYLSDNPSTVTSDYTFEKFSDFMDPF